MTLLTDEIKHFIGNAVTYPAREELSRASIRYFSLALDDPNPLYLNDAYAIAQGYSSLIAQPTLVVETCQYAHGQPDHRGYFGHSWHLEAPGCRNVRIANDYEFFRPLVPEDRISVTWTLEDIVEKSYSRGGTQLFVYSVARFYDARGELVAINRDILGLQPRKFNPDV